METYCNSRFAWRSPCTLTFDDGLYDVYRVAYPELKKRNIPFTVFIVTDYLDTDGYLSTQALRELAADPLVTIGSHGTSHAILTELPAQAQLRELAESKRILQEITGKEIRVFAYSHGQFNRTTLDLMKKHKLYDAAFSAGGGQTTLLAAARRYSLPRFNLTDQNTSYRIIRKKNYDHFLPV
ncbi:MAG: polysaccharide deacetylase family protein [Oscillospiraceae bacterium]|nr:polysaccharide deacetylase family protein [Oscillospiraceae bacterium]